MIHSPGCLLEIEEDKKLGIILFILNQRFPHALVLLPNYPHLVDIHEIVFLISA